MRDSFVFYRSFFEAICELPKKDRLPLFNSICDYALNGVEPELSGTSSAVFKLLKPQIDANNRKRENGLKGGRPRKRTDEELSDDKYRNSKEYKEWRAKVLERDGYKCVHCGATEQLFAHHIHDFYEFPEGRYDVDNGVTLCASCHVKEHTRINRAKTNRKPNANRAKTNRKPNVNVNVNVNENGDSEPNGNQKGVPISPEQKENRDRIMQGLKKAIQ